MVKHFPESWVVRLNEVVRTVRRQNRWTDVNALIEPPNQPEKPPLMRLECGGVTDVVPLTLPSVQQSMITGNQSPLLIEVKHAFIRFIKMVERQNKLARHRIQARKRI